MNSGKLTRWYWCGVFGELYGSASETRIALDFQQLMRISDPAATLPVTIAAAARANEAHGILPRVGLTLPFIRSDCNPTAPPPVACFTAA
jgi:hypothetical protein